MLETLARPRMQPFFLVCVAECISGRLRDKLSRTTAPPNYRAPDENNKWRPPGKKQK